MSSNPSNSDNPATAALSGGGDAVPTTESKALPIVVARPTDSVIMQSPPAPIVIASSANVSSAIAPAKNPARQLSELQSGELEGLASELGLDGTRYPSRQHLVAAIHARRQMIANLNREAMLDVVRWARRPVAPNAAREQLALQISGIKSMRFSGLSHRGLLVLARLRGLEINDEETIPDLVRKLKKQEGFFSRLNRKRRSMIGGIVSNMLGEDDREAAVTFVSPQSTTGDTAPAPRGDAAAPVSKSFSREASIKEEIEESGLIGGIANRVKKTADSYINQKLDEIESRIDRKLDEIDRRLAEWRDKEIANRIRILKITLWVSVIVGIFSLIYSYVQVYFPRHH